MQISKLFVALCAVAISIIPLCAGAADTDAQIKAREAMQKKLDELQQSQPATQPPAVAPQAPKKPAPTPVVKPTPTPVVKPAVEPPSIQPAPTTADSEAIAKAREAMRQKLNETSAPPVATTPVTPAPKPPPPARTVAPATRPKPPAQSENQVAKPAPTPAPQQVAKPPPKEVAKPAPSSEQAAKPAPAPKRAAKPTPAPVAAQPAPQPTLVIPASADPDAIAKARDAVRQKMGEMEGQPPAAVHANSVQPTPGATAASPPRTATQDSVTQPGPATAQSNAMPNPNKAAQPVAEAKPMASKPPKKASSKGLPTFTALEAPPSTVPPGKQQQLAELLRKYRADEVTPEQYHQERAKILSQP